MNANTNETENNATGDQNGAVAFNLVANLNLVGQGNVPNFKEKITEHVTITPDGTIVVSRFDDSTNC